jgi:hypothetical protein
VVQQTLGHACSTVSEVDFDTTSDETSMSFSSQTSVREFRMNLICYLYDPGGRQVSFQHGSVAAFTRPLKTFVTDSEGVLLVDFLARFENLERDWQEISKRIGVDAPLPRNNASRHPPYRDCYDDETRRMVSEMFREDLEFFGYQFEVRS